jgi:hypothetical protein
LIPGRRSFVDLALDAHYQDWYANKFCNHPALYDFIARFSDWELDISHGNPGSDTRRISIPQEDLIIVHANGLRFGGERAAAFVDLALDAHYQDWYANKFCNHPALYDFMGTQAVILVGSPYRKKI